MALSISTLSNAYTPDANALVDTTPSQPRVHSRLRDCVHGKRERRVTTGRERTTSAVVVRRTIKAELQRRGKKLASTSSLKHGILPRKKLPLQ